MIKFINTALAAFKGCFSRTAAFHWFITAVTGIMLRVDDMGGVTSIIRSLGLKPIYEPINRFFRSDAWDLHGIEETWRRFVANNAPLVKMNGYAVIIGDGIKVAKEAKRMPGVKRLHQESENSSKPEHIYGIMYGGVGVLAGKGGQEYCVPLACEVQDGIGEIMKWSGERGKRRGSHVVEMINLAYRTSEAFGKSIALLDRYFLTVPALERLHELNLSDDNRVEAIIMAKASTVAYEKPPARLPGTRGRTCVKGAPVKLAGMFTVDAERFKTAEVDMYGKKQTLRYHSADLLWGQKLYREMRFVLVNIEGRQVIISCTDTKMNPLDIIALYAKRFKIESTFKSLKHDVAAFAQRFWSRSMPKLNRFARKSEPDRLTKVKSKESRDKIKKAFEASEGYVLCGIIALGILQLISLLFCDGVKRKSLRYLRTPSKVTPSPATVADYLRKTIYRGLVNEPNLEISRIILGKMEAPDDRYFIKEAS